MKRAALYTLGCRLNQSETAIISDKLKEAGYNIVPFHDAADLAIINTCTVTGEADAKSRKAIRAFARKNPQAFIVVIGCYSELAHKELAEMDCIDLLMGTQNKLDVLDYVQSGKNERTQTVIEKIESDDFTIETLHTAPITRRTNLKIQEGCDCRCSYCTVPLARGDARSREIENLLQEATQIVHCGAKEIVLTGVNIGAYHYKDLHLIDVINRLAEIPKLRRLRLSSTEPMGIDKAIFQLMNDPNHPLMPHLHIPVQSGSATVLKIMNRPYTPSQLEDLIISARNSVKDLCIGIDIMAGMPGEGEKEFNETREFLASLPIDYAHVFKYSQRKETKAATLPGKVSPQIINQRSATIRKMAGKKHQEFLKKHTGKTMTVLFEHSENKQNNVWSGYTKNYIRVIVQSDTDMLNKIADTKLMQIREDKLMGKLARD